MYHNREAATQLHLKSRIIFCMVLSPDETTVSYTLFPEMSTFLLGRQSYYNVKVRLAIHIQCGIIGPKMCKIGFYA